MTTKENHHHRSALKQKNKPFKGGSGRSKSRGRIESAKAASVGKPGRTLNSVSMTKADRKNAAHLAQVARRAEMNQEKRLFSGRSGVPRNVVLVPLSPSVELGSVLSTLRKSSDEMSGGESMVDYVAEHRQSIRWIPAPFQDWSIMDKISVADVVVLVVSAQDSPDLDPRVYELLSVMRAQGISSAVGYIQDGAKLGKDARAEWIDRLTTEMSSISRVFAQADPESRETAECVRSLCSQKLAGISWRERRPYMLVDAVQYDEASRCMAVTGFGRGGQPFSANRLVHLPGLGTFSVAKIVLAAATHGRDSMSIDTMEQIRNPEVAESLQETLPVIPQEDMQDAAALDLSAVSKTTGKLKKKVRVPKGTSSYQAAWLSDVEEVDEEDRAEEEEEEEEVVLSDRDDSESEASAGEDAMEDDVDDPYEREAHRLDASRHSRDFPDRIDIPSGTPARVHLAQHRGLQSLRTASWDPEEGLPAEYNHIYQFENAQRSMHKALNGQVDSPFAVGQRITLVLEAASPEAAGAALGKTMYGLLPHEQRTSVLHFTVQPRIHTLHNNAPVVAWIGGIRRFVLQPVYSEHNPSAALHRMIRHVEPGTTAVATVYAPIHYPPGPVLLFSTAGELLSVGSILAGADPRRIILQRSTLTGASYKVHKRSAVVRWMFDNPADIAWFKPVELTTRSGRRGNIRESVGTHGHFKALFDKPLLSNEPVALHLYRRVFPLWDTTRMI